MNLKEIKERNMKGLQGGNGKGMMQLYYNYKNKRNNNNNNQPMHQPGQDHIEEEQESIFSF